MNHSKQKSTDVASLELYQRCLWSLAVAGVVMVFFFMSWISIQRAEIFIARRNARQAEARTSEVQREREVAIQERVEAMTALSQRLSKSEELRVAAEKKVAEMSAGAFKMPPPSQTEATVPQNAPMQPPQLKSSAPTVETLTAFIKRHLGNMMEPSVESQMRDYAEEVDFHDKPHATLAIIENERKQTAQRFPSRTILKDEIQPQLSANEDSQYQWIATATFNYRWIYKSRSGVTARGTTRDIWKIIPSEQGYKIIAEHSYDPATGRSKD